MSTHWNDYNVYTNELLGSQYSASLRQHALSVAEYMGSDTPTNDLGQMIAADAAIDVDYSLPAYSPRTWVDWFSFFNPQWYINQHFFFVVAFGASTEVGNEAILGNAWVTFEKVNYYIEGLTEMAPAKFSVFYWSDYDWFWNYSLIAPFAYIVGLTGIGLILKERK